MTVRIISPITLASSVTNRCSKRTIAILLSALSLTACGGGSSGGGTPAASNDEQVEQVETLPIESEAPPVLTTIPETGIGDDNDAEPETSVAEQVKEPVSNDIILSAETPLDSGGGSNTDDAAQAKAISVEGVWSVELAQQFTAMISAMIGDDDPVSIIAPGGNVVIVDQHSTQKLGFSNCDIITPQLIVLDRPGLGNTLSADGGWSIAGFEAFGTIELAMKMTIISEDSIDLSLSYAGFDIPASLTRIADTPSELQESTTQGVSCELAMNNLDEEVASSL